MRENQRQEVTNHVRQSYLDFLTELEVHGVDLSNEQRNLLIREKIIKERVPQEKIKSEISDRSKFVDTKTAYHNEADKYIDIVEGTEDIPFAESGKRHIILDHETYDKLSESSIFKYQGGKTITSDDWKPKDILQHSEEFVNWINSINRGFQDMLPYKPFAMYCQQSQNWIDEDTNIHDYKTQLERKDYAYGEFKKCEENTLYFMDKYFYLKEGDVKGGQMKYLSKPVHKVLCFLVDAGYSLMAGKPRQIAATSTMGGIALCKVLFKRNFFLKLVAQDKDKTIEIFEDKIKFPFGEIPGWMKPEVGNDRDNLLRFTRKTEKKGSKGGVNSKIQVVAPSVSAINGGSPQLVLVDEAGYIGILGKMIKEARPTMFMMDEKTGKLVMARQIVVWGTGGEMDKGGKSFEAEFYSNLKLWNEGTYSSGMIPLFFDWTTRPGITKEHYLNEKKVYTVEGPEKESKAVQFRQTYPSVIEDMFLTSYKLLVGADWINEQAERIKKTEFKWKPTRGYFEPIYDETVQDNENSDTPFKIVGSRFVACDDQNMDMATCSVLMNPKNGWKNRYFQGTDPIMTDNGYSNMASVVYDIVLNTPVAIMDYRDPDHKYTFLQCLLLGLYYDTMKEGCIKELVESNIGTAYFDYKESKGFYNSLVQRTELPDYLRGGSSLYGIDNRGATSASRGKFIINKLHEVLTVYGDRFYFLSIFTQLRTFICTVTERGSETWGVTDTRKFNDDVLFGLVFSYICALTYSHRTPINVNSESTATRVEFRLTRDARGKLTRTAVKVRT
jgi:hypothetical protein